MTAPISRRAMKRRAAARGGCIILPGGGLTHKQRDRFRADDARFDAAIERVIEAEERAKAWIAQRETDDLYMQAQWEKLS